MKRGWKVAGVSTLGLAFLTLGVLRFLFGSGVLT